MDYTIYGVKIRAAMVMNRRETGTTELWFGHDIPMADRTALADQDIAVFFDPATNFWYLTVDTSLLSRKDDTKGTEPTKCECGAKAVGASRHSNWCPCT